VSFIKIARLETAHLRQEIRAPLLRVRARMSVPGRKVARQEARLRQHPGDLPDATHIRMPGPVPVRRAYKFRAYPTRPQDGRASRLLADHCDLYNAALQERREAWRMRQARARNVYARAGLGSGQAAHAA
jgi:Helix-turn-helix domain